MTGRFDPHNPEDPRGKCTSCALVLATEEDVKKHLSETFEAAKAAGSTSGHGVQILRSTRAELIQRYVSSELDDALNEVVDDLFKVIDRGDATRAEITEAVKWQYADLSDAWEAALLEEEEDAVLEEERE